MHRQKVEQELRAPISALTRTESYRRQKAEDDMAAFMAAKEAFGG